jgi:hypothetical protein
MMKGINEMGLSYDMNWIPTEKLIPHPEKKPQDQWAIKHIMKNFTTVEEVLSIIFTYNWGNSIFYQIHFADKYGDAVAPCVRIVVTSNRPATDGEAPGGFPIGGG